MNFKKKIRLLWLIFALLDPCPDPLTRLNADPIRIRIPIWIRNPVEKWKHRRHLRSSGTVLNTRIQLDPLSFGTMDKDLLFSTPNLFKSKPKLLNSPISRWNINNRPEIMYTDIACLFGTGIYKVVEAMSFSNFSYLIVETNAMWKLPSPQKNFLGMWGYCTEFLATFWDRPKTLRECNTELYL